jgi:hypothetical protein
MRGEARVYIREQEPEPASPDIVKQQMLEAENRELRTKLRHLQSALRCAARTLKPYADAKR